jgi:hypothetical protein
MPGAGNGELRTPRFGEVTLGDVHVTPLDGRIALIRALLLTKPDDASLAPREGVV